MIYLVDYFKEQNLKSIIIDNVLESKNPGYISSFIASELNIDKVFFFVPSILDNIDYSFAKNSEYYPIFHDKDYSKENLERKNYVPKHVLTAMESQKHQILSQINRWRNNYPSIIDWHSTQLIYFKLLDYWYNFLILNNVVCFSMSTPHAVDNTIIRCLCNTMGIMTFNESNFAFEDSYLTVLTHGISDFTIENLEGVTLSDNFYYEYQKIIDPTLAISLKVYDTSIKSKLHYSKYLVRRLISHIRRNKYRVLFKKFVYYSTIDIKEKNIFKFIKKNEVSSIDENLNFFYFPLHFQPEATTSLFGGIYENQLSIIQTISSTLPSNCILLVKEHPAYWKKKYSDYFHSINEYRSIDYYRTLLNMKNVLLVDHNYDTLQLVKSALGVVTVNGSICLEALKYHKPVIIFGNHFFKYLPNVVTFENSDTLKSFYDLALSQSLHISDNQILDFYRLLQINSYELLTSTNLIDSADKYSYREKVIDIHLKAIVAMSPKK
jgi:hypothetical protein